jgi:predicted nicotinamide N-methyase
VLWPSGVILARYLSEQFRTTKNPSSSNCCWTRARRILELGAGCGLVGIVAAQLLQRRSSKTPSPPSPPPAAAAQVILTDFNRTVLHNLQRNVILNNVKDMVSVVGLDFSTVQETESAALSSSSSSSASLWHDMEGNVHDRVDLILAADVICQPSDAIAVARTIHTLLVPGGHAILVSATSAHRFGVDILADECRKRSGLVVQVTDLVVEDVTAAAAATNDENDNTVRSLLDHASGYVPGMTLQLFCVTKVQQPPPPPPP